jgi:membrane-associated protein
MIFGLDKVIVLLLHYRYFVLFPIAFFEGPIISVIAGFLVARGFFNFLFTYGLLVLADLAGDTFYYCLGRLGGRPFLRRWGHLFGLKKEKLESMENNFRDHSTKIIFLGKTQSWGGLILFTAGETKMPFLKFIWLNLIATILKSLLFLVVGYYFGEAYVLIEKYIRYGGIGLSIITIFVIVYFFLRNKRKKAKSNL